MKLYHQHGNIYTTDMKLLFPLVMLMIIQIAVGSSISLQICHSHCNIGEVDCILQCPHLLCEQDCTRAEERCVHLCDANYTTTQRVITADPNLWMTKRTTPAPTTQDTPTPSTIAMVTEDIKPTPKPHHSPTTQISFPSPETFFTTDEQNGVVVIG